MSVRKWIVTLIALFLIGIAVLFVSNAVIFNRLLNTVTMPQITDALRQKYEFGLKNVVDSEAQNLAQRLKGVSNPEEQKKLLEQYTDYQRFFPNDEGYFFTYDLSGKRVNVPTGKSLNGKDCLDLKDANGVPFVREFIKVVQQGGSGFVEYLFEKPGAGVQPKLSYVKRIPGTDLLVGTGIYIDSVSREKARISEMVNDSSFKYVLYQVGIGLAIVLVLLVIGGYVAMLICTPLVRITGAVTKVAAGDLTARSELPPHSPTEVRELHRAMRAMVGTLQHRLEEADKNHRAATEAVEQSHAAQRDAEASALDAQQNQQAMQTAARELEGIADALFSTATQLSAQIEQSDRGATESAQHLAESATAMNQMNATVQEVAQNASHASATSGQTRDKAQSGAKVVERVVQSIASVHTISLELKRDMTQLDSHAQSISQIMGVISDIADQTNLLALNAAIEAARAGEAGRGFAVVADEVRKLAEKTMASTHDVGSAIRAIQDSTAQSVSAVEHAVQQIAQATEFANESGAALQEIVTTVDSSADQVNAIATASEEQSAASEEINRSIMKANALSTQTVSAMGSANSAVTDLVTQARRLTGLISTMK